MKKGTDTFKFKVSVIITTYKRTNSLKRAILSVDRQTLNEVEIIVVDDNSADSEFRKENIRLIEKLKLNKPLKYVKHEINQNGAVARNSGIKVAEGEFISFLDDDDYYYPDKLRIEYETLSKLDVSYGGIVCEFDIYRNSKKIKYNYEMKSGNFLFETLGCIYQMGSGSNIFIRSSVISEIGLFDESFTRHQDYEFMVRFFEKYNIYSVNKKLFGIEQKNKHSNRPNILVFLEIKKHYLRKYRYLIEQLPINKQKKIKKLHKRQLIKMIIKSKKIWYLPKIIMW